MESKYYTPSVEEFYVGFEYEILERDKTWSKTSFGDNNSEEYNNELSDCYRFIAGSQIRVKYLDKEDVESLGFETVSEAKLKTYELKGSDKHFVKTTLKREYVDEDVIITILDKQKLIIRRNNTRNMRAYDNYKTLDVFVGIIKNKSEFKKLLKQLIIE